MKKRKLAGKSFNWGAASLAKAELDPNQPNITARVVFASPTLDNKMKPTQLALEMCARRHGQALVVHSYDIKINGQTIIAWCTSKMAKRRGRKARTAALKQGGKK